LPLEDYLMPSEQVKFQSNSHVHYGGKTYQVVLTDRRIVLYARRGALMKSDDVVTQNLEGLQAVKYREEGLIDKKGIIKVQSLKTEMDLSGPAKEMKAMYQQMMQFM